MSVVVFGCVFAGAILGMMLRTILPEHHLNADTKDVVKLGVGLIGTMSALVLGLLVASAKSSYDTRRGELAQMATNIILLDRTLAHYGPETQEIRQNLKTGAGLMIDQIWARDGSSGETLKVPTVTREVIFDKIQDLAPQTDVQRALQSRAESFAMNIGQTRWLLVEQSESAISIPFLVVVVFWLSILFVSFGLFAPRNATVVVTLLVSAMSVAGAIFLILELDHPFSGLIQLSSGPLRNALAVLGK